ncbi:MAG: hypothetical protein L0H70_10155, partial [Xanthomonadales bacterium]|nr:hypothetical protein [Xanthomonadales bacterium]
MRPWLLMLTLACALGGCTASNDPTPATPKAVATARSATAASAAPAVDHFASNAYGFSIDYPANMHVSRNFASSYLANGAWKSYAGPKS